MLVALGLKKTLGYPDEALKIEIATALFGGAALYLLAHVAIRLRNIGSVIERTGWPPPRSCSWRSPWRPRSRRSAPSRWSSPCSLVLIAFETHQLRRVADPRPARALGSARGLSADRTAPRPDRANGDNGVMRVSAKADYAVRAAVELAAADAAESRHVKGVDLAKAQKIPLRFLENILGELRHAGIVQSQRGTDGGYWLARSADDITVAEIIRAVEGPLASVRGERPEDLEYRGDAEPLRDVWVALRANIRQVLESVTLADIVDDACPPRSRRSSISRRSGSRTRQRPAPLEAGAEAGGRSADRPPGVSAIGGSTPSEEGLRLDSLRFGAGRRFLDERELPCTGALLVEHLGAARARPDDLARLRARAARPRRG